MPFECKKYHCKCKAECCGVVPIPAKIWQRNQHKIVRHPVEKHKVMAGEHNKVAKLCILPLTENGYCPFLNEDLSCNIYDDRPEICKKFGDESHLMLTCPMQRADGTPRTDEERDEFNTQVNAFFKRSN